MFIEQIKVVVFFMFGFIFVWLALGVVGALLVFFCFFFLNLFRMFLRCGFVFSFFFGTV